MTGRVLAPFLALMLIFSTPLLADPQASAPPDLAVIRGALVGTWQSTDDTKFTREFAADGSSTDRYDGDVSATTLGHWMLFLGSAPPAALAARSLQPDGIYLKLDQNGDQLLFVLVGMTRSELKMVYLERGNLLSFVRLK